MADALQPVDVVRVNGASRATSEDLAATEEPLEVRLHGAPFAVIMRTPGADGELAAGFLFSERVLRSADELGAIEHCKAPGGDHLGNMVNVTLTSEVAARVESALAERRRVTTNSSCGLCGRLTIDSLITDLAALQDDVQVAEAVVATLPDRLRSAQRVFDATGGLHAAGLFTPAGRLQMSAEDVGRHNAVDKVVGRMLMNDALPLTGTILFVSGRASFEIVQKAFLAGIPVVASVSAPSSLAIDLARDASITLVGFVRGSSFNIYTRPERII
jgi:FdhD protein